MSSEGERGPPRARSSWRTLEKVQREQDRLGWQRITEHVRTHSIPEVWQPQGNVTQAAEGGSGNVASKPKVNSGSGPGRRT